MGIIRKIAVGVRALLGTWADEVDQETRVIQRQRKFSARTLAQTFVFGFLAKPNATDEDLAKMSAAVGNPVSTQAVDQRYSQRLVDFLAGLFRKGVGMLVRSPCCVPGILEKFADVQLLDSRVGQAAA